MMEKAKRVWKVLLSEGGSVRLRDYEIITLLAWRELLPKTGVDILDRQIRMLTWLNRQTDELYTLFHSDCKGDWPEEVLFPSRVEGTAAQVFLHAAGKPKAELKCEIELFRGRLFALKFDRPPKEVFSVAATFGLSEFKPKEFVRSSEIKIARMRLSADPMNTLN